MARQYVAGFLRAERLLAQRSHRLPRPLQSAQQSWSISATEFGKQETSHYCHWYFPRTRLVQAIQQETADTRCALTHQGKSKSTDRVKLMIGKNKYSRVLDFGRWSQRLDINCLNDCHWISDSFTIPIFRNTSWWRSHKFTCEHRWADCNTAWTSGMISCVLLKIIDLGCRRVHAHGGHMIGYW
jgi:hypothetical protein